MPFQKPSITLIMIGLLILAVAGLSLATTGPASAQCGSQASSCKNCHEVQGKMPVNNDGTDWHTSHAFGDFCQICHFGNNQAMDADAAHVGMVDPLSDIKGSCQQCHPNDMQELAQIYATTLGVEVGAGGAVPPSTGGAAPEGAPSSPAQPAASQPGALQPGAGDVAMVSAPAASELVVDDANLVDFVQRYNEIVLGKKPVNTGNLILIGLIALIAFGGGGFVLYNEFGKKLFVQKVSVLDGEYPKDVVELIPAISKLKPDSRHSLKTMLENPQKTETILKLVDTLVSDENSNEEKS